MKKTLLLALLVCTCASSFAITYTFNVFQNHWRWRSNNGGEATATWKAAQDSAISFNGKGVIRLRIEIINTSINKYCPVSNGCENLPLSIDMYDSLQYSTNPTDAKSWINIGVDKRKAFIIKGAGGHIVQDQLTTAQLTDTAYIFSAGKTMVTDSVIKNITIPGNSRSEFEWSLQATAKALPSTTYYFRQRTRFNLRVYTQYLTAYPSLHTPAKQSAADLTGVETVKANDVSAGKAIVTVFPNPAHSSIGFTLSSKPLEKIQAILTDASGRVIYQQAFENIQPNTLYRLNLTQQPAAGLYILKLTGNGLSESHKVIVE